MADEGGHRGDGVGDGGDTTRSDGGRTTRGASASGDGGAGGRRAPATDRRALGADGEKVASDWYEARGYEVLARNWRCRDGEIDLILAKDRLYVFCEVKARSSDVFGYPAEAVTHVKQARIRRLAARWLAEGASRPPRAIRFDVVAILAGRVEVLEGAF